MEKENIHAGHRERLLQTVFDGDFNTLSKIQQVEVMLFYIFPRGDVNPLAHRLLDYFGSFSAILEADVQDMMNVKGMGRMSAIKIKNLLPIFQRFKESRVENRVSMVTVKDLIEVFDDLLGTSQVEETVIVSLDRASVCNGVRRIARGDDRSVGMELKKIYNFIDTYKSYAIYIGHNHPRGTSSASQKDLETFQYLRDAVRNYGCMLKDSLIVSDYGVYSLDKNDFLFHRVTPAYATIMEMHRKRSVN